MERSISNAREDGEERYVRKGEGAPACGKEKGGGMRVEFKGLSSQWGIEWVGNSFFKKWSIILGVPMGYLRVRGRAGGIPTSSS